MRGARGVGGAGLAESELQGEGRRAQCWPAGSSLGLVPAPCTVVCSLQT